MTEIRKVSSLILSHNIHFFFSSYERQDFLEDPCLTPDCAGRVVNIQLFDTEGLKIEVKQFLSFTRAQFIVFAFCKLKEYLTVSPVAVCWLHVSLFYASSYFCFSSNTKGSLPNQNPNPKLPSKIK